MVINVANVLGPDRHGSYRATCVFKDGPRNWTGSGIGHNEDLAIEAAVQDLTHILGHEGEVIVDKTKRSF